jgi:biopolymer transport protein ExbD
MSKLKKGHATRFKDHYIYSGSSHGGHIQSRPGKPAQSDINVTPLIDVVLVLLIIFMVLTPILIEEMAVHLPDKTETVEQEDMPEQQLVAATCADGTYALNRQVMDLPHMQEEITRQLRSKSSRIVFVDAHPDVDYARVVEMIDAVRAAGADTIGMATLKTNEDFNACMPFPVAAVVPAEGDAAATNTVPPPQ